MLIPTFPPVIILITQRFQKYHLKLVIKKEFTRLIIIRIQNNWKIWKLWINCKACLIIHLTAYNWTISRETTMTRHIVWKISFIATAYDDYKRIYTWNKVLQSNLIMFEFWDLSYGISENFLSQHEVCSQL